MKNNKIIILSFLLIFTSLSYSQQKVYDMVVNKVLLGNYTNWDTKIFVRGKYAIITSDEYGVTSTLRYYKPESGTNKYGRDVLAFRNDENDFIIIKDSQWGLQFDLRVRGLPTGETFFDIIESEYELKAIMARRYQEYEATKSEATKKVKSSNNSTTETKKSRVNKNLSSNSLLINPYSIKTGMTAEPVVDKYIEAIGGKDKVDAIKTTMIVFNATFQGTPLVMTMKSSAPNKTLQEIAVMGSVMQKSVFNGETGYQSARGQKMDMQQAQIDEAKANLVPFSDMAYKKGTLDRIEPIDGVNYYVVQFNDTEVFYDMKTGLKAKKVKTVKTPDGKEVKVPTTFGNYKAVNGVLFPYSVGIKSGPMDLNFEVKEIKVNEGVTDADFE